MKRPPWIGRSLALLSSLCFSFLEHICWPCISELNHVLVWTCILHGACGLRVIPRVIDRDQSTLPSERPDDKLFSHPSATHGPRHRVPLPSHVFAISESLFASLSSVRKASTDTSGSSGVWHTTPDGNRGSVGKYPMTTWQDARCIGKCVFAGSGSFEPISRGVCALSNEAAQAIHHYLASPGFNGPLVGNY